MSGKTFRFKQVKKLVGSNRSNLFSGKLSESMSKFCNYDSIATVRFAPCKEDIRPYLKFNVCNFDIYGLLDSGASISILGNESHADFIKFGFEMHQMEPTSCNVANGVVVQSIGYIFVPVTFKNVTHVIKFYVIPSIVSDVILGVDFWHAFRLAPEIFDNIAYIKTPDKYFNVCNTIGSEQVHTIQSYDYLTPTQKELANAVVDNFKNISSEEKGLGRTSLIEHVIDTGDARPIKTKQYPLSPEKRAILSSELDRMLALDVVTPCESPWNNPALLVKKSNGDWRFCLDCRKLNAVTKGDSYSIPYIPQILDSLKEAKYLTSIDLSSSFWQIPLNKSSQEKTAFTVPGRGLFMFKVMPFGLCGAPARQQRLMDQLIDHNLTSDIENGLAFCYIDDIVICSSDFQTHLVLLNRVLEKLKMANLTVNFEKSKFFRQSLKYLGYVVDEFGLRTDPDKVAAILNFPTPTTSREVKIFLGTCSWYRRFIRNFSTIAAPLNRLTSKGKTAPAFQWSDEAENAFNALKNALVSAPILAVPDFDKPFAVHCDASSYGIGGMLSQTIDGHEHPIAYVSRSLNKCERNYSATEREALAVLFSVEKYQAYLGSRRFKVITDHASLKWFMNLENPSGRLARWGCRLSQFNFDIEHRKGTDNVVPDALSRLMKVDAVKVVSAVNDANDVNDEWYDKTLNGCRSHPANYPNFCIKDGKLLRFSKGKYSLLREFDWKEVVRKGDRKRILEENHCEPTAAHLGVFKTHRRLSLTYFWPGMYKDVVEFVKACDVCSAYKHSQQKTPGLMGRPKVCHKPWQVVSVDLVGPLPRSKSGYTFLFVVTCCFSKFTVLMPLRRATSALVAKNFENHVILAHGAPETVIADNGVQFTGSDFRKLLLRYKVPNFHLAPRYSPQVNLVERYNKTVMTAVSSYVNENHRSWDEQLPKIQFAINSAVNESTSFTPFFLVHAREPVINGSFYKDTDQPYEVAIPREEYAGDFGCLKGIFEKVRSHLLKAHEQNSRHYNLRRRPAKHAVGDIVWKRTYVQSDAQKFKMAKLAPKYEKCRVKAVLSPLVYELERMDGHPIGSWHIKDLKS